MYNSTVIKTRREVFQLSCGKIYFNQDNLVDEQESNFIWKKLISYRNSWKLLLLILWFFSGVFFRPISCRFLDQESKSQLLI